jgi:pantothenate kinase
LKSPQDATEVLYAPSFSHSLKDPIENDIPIQPRHKIVILEGLYLHLKIDPWSQLEHFFDERWFLDIDMAVAAERLAKRHVETGVGECR